MRSTFLAFTCYTCVALCRAVEVVEVGMGQVRQAINQIHWIVPPKEMHGMPDICDGTFDPASKAKSTKRMTPWNSSSTENFSRNIRFS